MPTANCRCRPTPTLQARPRRVKEKRDFKEVQFSTVVGDNDFEVKVRAAPQWPRWRSRTSMGVAAHLTNFFLFLFVACVRRSGQSNF
jgi:hypothetical protein